MKTDKRFWVIAGAYDDKEQAVGVMRKLDTVVREAAVLDMDQRQDAGLRALTDAVLLLAEGQAETVKQMQMLIAALGAGMRIAGESDAKEDTMPAPDVPKERPLARLIRERVKDLGLTFSDLARQSNSFSASAVSRWAGGELPRRAYLHDIAAALALPYNTLLDAYNRSIVG